ncbi:tetratricopeptide repeat protein [Streptomyces hydrogenans]|uniref:tetratricopeptide repeat protein n=1 Tax=Streptomyces hydrogenans TaxID=1873719 RepID=UPI0036CC8317
MLTSAHVAARPGGRAEVFQPGRDSAWSGVVVWCGAPGGRDDAALVLLDDDPAWPSPEAVRWGRMVTDEPGAGCRTWGVPDVAQRPGQPAEAVQAEGRINPGSGFVGNQYVVDLLQHPPQWTQQGTSPWGGLSGAAVFCGRLLTGVVASDRAHSGHGQLNAVPAYVLHHDPAFRAVLAEHGGPAAGLEAVEFQHLADAHTGGGAGTASPAALLQAGRQTVPFHGREDLLADLLTWCGRGGWGAWLLHGPGGQGKTRLAHHLGGLLAAGNWAVLWPRSDAEVPELRELRQVVKPLLVVLDYAEARTGQLTALVEAAAGHGGGTPFKVLLLARTDGDWWTQAKSATRLTEDHLDEALSILLAPLEQTPGSRAQAYRTAARALAGALPRVRGLARHDWSAAADALPAPRLDHDGYANALTLQMTALADLLDTATPGGKDTTEVPVVQWAQEVEDRLLGHERRYWQHSAATHGLSPALSRATLEKALAAAHLVGAADHEQADRTWSTLPALADQARDRRDQVTAWIAALYPPAAPGRPWGALQPDRLAERHIGRILDADPSLAEHLINGADDAQTAQLLTVYSRAAAPPPFAGRLDAHLTGLCTRLPHRLTPHVIATAVQADHPQPLITALDTLTTDPTTDIDDLNTLYNHFPDSSRRLARTTVHLTQAITSHYRALAEADPDAHLPNLAVSLNNLSNHLADAGRRAEGLTAVEEAVRHYGTLAEANPDAHLPNLAMSLNNLSLRLVDAGRPAEALTAIQEAVRHYRTLAKANPDTHLPNLATSLNNLSAVLGDAGRPAEGLAAVEEAVRIRHTLAEPNPDAYLPGLAMSLNNLSLRLADAGRPAEALTAIQEAVRHYRTLAEANPDAYLPDLAMSLNNLSNRLAHAGQPAEALTAIQEAVRIRRTLAEANPDAYLPDLAMSLNNLSLRLADAGRPAEGLAAVEEAVRIRHTLAEPNPDAYLPGLAMSLNNLSLRLADAGRPAEGLAAVEEAVRHYRTLVEANPDAYLPGLAMSLNNLSNRLGEAGRPTEALTTIQEAVRHYRTLAEAKPDTHLPDLAMSLNNLSNRLGEAGRRAEALTAVEEAVRHYRTLAEANPEMFDAALRRSLEVAAWLRSLPQ